MVTSGWLLAFFSPSYSEMLLLMLVALLLYGGDLPKVARSWGKTLAEFRKGLTGLQNEFNDSFREPIRRIPYTDPIYSEQDPTKHTLNDQGYVDAEFDDAESSSAVTSVFEGDATVSEIPDDSAEAESELHHPSIKESGT